MVILLLHILLLASLQFTTQAVPHSASISSNTANRISRDSPSSTALAVPAIATNTNENCNIEGSIPAASIPFHDELTVTDPLECLYECLSISFCQSYSWNTTAAAGSPSCFTYSGYGVPGLPIVAGETGIFYSAKEASCYTVAELETTSSGPFAGEEGVYVNTAVDDCGIEGSTSFDLNPSYKCDSILDCQTLCNSENGCISYGWDANTTGLNCGYCYSWLAGNITPGNTSVYWSEGKEKTGYDCFSSAPSDDFL